jgi:hypothetical protein
VQAAAVVVGVISLPGRRASQAETGRAGNEAAAAAC